MNLVLFVIVIIISMIVVRIGAIAFQLTGLDWSFAKFQALSCFTGTVSSLGQSGFNDNNLISYLYTIHSY